MIIDVKAEALRIQEQYKTKRKAGNISALIMGTYGVGKTTMLGTGRRPILVHSFDPNGTEVLEQEYPDLIASGDLLIETFWVDSSDNPLAYKAWDKQWDAYKRSRFFDSLGTYCIDSGTLWIEALANQTSLGNKLGPGELEIGDYKIIKNTIKDYVKMMADFSCDFFLTMHLVNEKDSVTGELIAEADVFPSLRESIPRLFTEKWIVQRKGKEVTVLMEPQGRFKASTQIGSKTFDAKEGANIRALLKKAGKDYKHKPSLFGERKEKDGNGNS